MQKENGAERKRRQEKMDRVADVKLEKEDE